MYDFLNAIPMDELADLMIVSHVDLVKGEGGVKGLTEGLGMSVAHAAATSACAAGSSTQLLAKTACARAVRKFLVNFK